MSKITKRFVESIMPDSKKTLIFWDSELKGFGVVVLPSGRKTYCIQYRNTVHIKKRLKVGVHGQITAEQARDLAKKKPKPSCSGRRPHGAKKNRNGFSAHEGASNSVF